MSWRIRSSESSSRLVTIATSSPSASGRARSRTSPPTLTASAARASPGPIAAARSAPLAPSASSFFEPSGRITCMERRMLDARGLREAIRTGEHTGPTAGLAPGYTQANLVALPAGRRLRLPALLRAEPQALPGARRHRRRLPRARADGPGRRPAHRRPALPDLARRRARRGAGGRERALARRPRRLPDRLLVHVRARARGGGAADPPRRAGRQRADVPHRHRLHARPGASPARSSSRCAR